MHTQTDTIEEIDWEQILIPLEAYALSFAKKQSWFRGSDTSVFLEGKEIRDYVYEGIGRFIENPEKFDQSKGTLLNYLKYNLVRSLISNDVNKSENKLSKDIFTQLMVDDESDNTTSYLDRVMPFVNALFDEEIDYVEIIAEIEQQIKGDKIPEEIFIGLNAYGLKRSEIMDEFKMSSKDFDNGMKRLQTVLRGVALRFNLKKGKK